MAGMPTPSGKLSEASTAKWHSGEDENNPRYLEPMRLAFEEKRAQREHAVALLQRDAAYTRAVAAFVSILTFVAGAALYAVGHLIAERFGQPGVLGGSVLAVLGAILYLFSYPKRAAREFLAAVRSEERLKDAAKNAEQEARDKQRQLDESVKIVDNTEPMSRRTA